VAELPQHISVADPRLSRFRIECQSLLIGSGCFFMAGEFDQRIGATEPGLSRVWLQRECLIVCCKCLIVALKLPQDISPSEPGFGKRGFKGKRLIIGLDRFVVTASANHRHRAFSISASARSNLSIWARTEPRSLMATKWFGSVAIS
jgi:hypothetical protein